MGKIIPETEKAARAANALADGRVVVLPRGKGKVPVELPASVVRLIADVLDHAQRGESVTLVPADEEITTQQAADLLSVSRPYLVELVDRGDLPCRRVGARRRLRLADVLLYRDIESARRRKAVERLADEAQQFGLY